MSRAGIFNFWYYDDEEFVLEQGRLMLRGTNGAGKSVTMQSFIPLVLDGNKHPKRLDPFGSRDRRIEYYLLGEDDRHTDRIGYLWLEFHHPVKNFYKTIGIGLRAKKNSANVGFWGFVLDDGRRINLDFWLYDRNAWIESKAQYPLDRRELEERIGAGGKVVQDQKSYQQLVNNALFGFYDSESYGDLLELLIQLRSPKLSKDFKPSAIYEILTDALPPLQEDDLRPLSEVLEDLDQMSDRLEELKLQRQELDKLQQVYDRYNRLLLLTASEQAMEAKSGLDAAVREWKAVHSEREHKERDLEENVRKLEETEKALASVQADLDVLSRHDGIGKHEELQRLEDTIQETLRREEQSRSRLTAAETKIERLERDAGEAEREAEDRRRGQRDVLEEMEGMARDSEFYQHDVYHRYWNAGAPDNDAFLAPWRADAAKHREALAAALQLGEREREEARRVEAYDRELGDVRQQRDESERNVADKEKACEKQLAEQKEWIVRWRGSLRHLALEEEELSAMLRRLSELTVSHRTYGNVRAFAVQAHDRFRRGLTEQELRLIAEKQAAETSRSAAAAELQAWKESREPEPARTEKRSRERESRQAGQGAPLYAVCEFQPHIDEVKQGLLEAALASAGVLDAWISLDGRTFLVTDEGEETWAVPEPIEFGYTLADYLKASPSEESGLTTDAIEAVLRSFAWSEDDVGIRSLSADAVWGVGEAAMPTLGFGKFHLGPLHGKITSQGPAQFIGKEARRRYKKTQMTRLEAEIEAWETELTRIGESLRELRERAAEAEAELNDFPDDAGLQEKLQEWATALNRMQVLVEQEQRMSERLRQMTADWQRLRTEFVAGMSGWSRLKTLNDLREAAEQMRSYSENITALWSEWKQYRQASGTLERIRAELAELAETKENEQEELDQLSVKRQQTKVQADSLRKWMKEQGIENLYEQISALELSKRSLDERRNREDRQIRAADREIAVLQEREKNREERVREEQMRTDRALHRWRTELGLGLVSDWVASTPSGDSNEDKEAGYRLCREIRSSLQSLAGRSVSSATTSLHDQFHAVKHLLLDYALEMQETPETGRLQMLSMQDRSRPKSPAVLLAEVEFYIEEQNGLLGEKDRELYEEIILRSVGKAIRQRIQRASHWIKEINKLMGQRNTSGAFRLQLDWVPRPAQSEQEMNAEKLVDLLMKDARLLHPSEIDEMSRHFRSRVGWAKQAAQEERESLRKQIYELLDYRTWFQFELRYQKGEATAYRPLTDARFNTFSGGEKAMSMYIPLFAATSSRYADAGPETPRIISLDEAFAGVDDENIRDLFELLTDMDFDYMMTSQALWGCYDTVPRLGIVEIYRPKDADYVTLFRYRWNGKQRELVE
ncbi:TIGR02680 family protein [Cohnella candidum]|uniref:TIGR02680 family protein n=1 Tax=Cohnella candidum TaxID=2674991 RepID=A0A3G3K369_9BACL|nr:TIGR02680 family protein [Cohnella candidum]